MPFPGGTYTIVAHEPGYSVYNETYTLAPGTDLNLTAAKSIVLTNRGTIEGTIHPASNNGHTPSLTVDTTPETVLGNGQFSVSELFRATTYNVSVSLTGYQSAHQLVLVTPGNTTWVNFTLSPPPTCEQLGNCPHNNTTGGNNGSSMGITTLEWIGIGVIVLLVVVIAAVLLMRRGGGGASAPAPSPSMTSDAGTPSTPMEPMPDGGSTAPPPASP